MSVMVDDVRAALNEIDASQIPDSTIEQKIGFAEMLVQSRGADPTDDNYEHVVREVAAYHAFTSSPPMARKRAVGQMSSWDVQSFIEELKNRKDAALEAAGASSGGGTSAAFFEHTDGILDFP